MGYNIIPQDVVVDNVTLEVNGSGEIQIKGGGVSQSLLDNYIINSSKLAKSYVYGTVNNYLDVFTSEVSTPLAGTTYQEVYSGVVTMNLSSQNVRFNLDLASFSDPSTSYAQIKVNGIVQSTQTNTNGSTYQTKSFDLTLSKDDVVSIELKNSVGSFKTKCRNFKIKGDVETISYNSYTSL